MMNQRGVSQRDAYGSITSFLTDGSGYEGPPTDRMVRKWHQDSPGYPEIILSTGVISHGDIAPHLRGLLEGQAPTLGLGQIDQGPPSTGTWETTVEDAARLGGFILGAIIVGKALHQLFRAQTLARPLGSNDQKRYGLRRW
jgi:hypothetical protein